MTSQEDAARPSKGIVRIGKKGVAWVIFTLATFLNTKPGKVCAVLLLLSVMSASTYYAHVILFPILFGIMGALWRRILFYVVWRKLSSHKRRLFRNTWKSACALLRRKWGSIPFLVRVLIHCTIGVVFGMTLLHYLHIWSIAAYITAILPIPVFLEVYIGQKLPHMLAGFVQRQGLVKLGIDGGWSLVPEDFRHGAKVADRIMTKVIKRPIAQGPRSFQDTLARLERIRALREKRKAEAQTTTAQLERDLAALD